MKWNVMMETKGERREKKRRKKREMCKSGAGLRDTQRKIIERSEEAKK